jgi:hypothetical protein
MNIHIGFSPWHYSALRYIHRSIYTYIHIYTFICIHIYIYIFIYIYDSVYIYAYIQMNIHIGFSPWHYSALKYIRNLGYMYYVFMYVLKCMDVSLFLLYIVVIYWLFLFTRCLWFVCIGSYFVD